MQTQKRSSITLSLHQEIEREAQEIEKEMARHTELDEIQVTEAMDRALIKKIQAYEKEMEEKRAAEKAGEDARKIRNASVEVEEEIISDDSDGYGQRAGSIRNGYGEYRKRAEICGRKQRRTDDLSEEEEKISGGFSGCGAHYCIGC